MGGSDQKILPDGTDGTGALTVDGTLDLNGYSPTIGDLEGNGVVTNTSGASTLSVGGGDATGTFSGVIQNGSGTVALAKVGSGTVTLTGSEHLQRRDDDQRLGRYRSPTTEATWARWVRRGGGQRLAGVRRRSVLWHR